MDYRNLIYGVDKSYKLKNGKQSIYVNFDNAATTPPFSGVVAELNKFMNDYSSINRGMGAKSQISTEKYENAREKVAQFVGANTDDYSVIFVKNTTEAINKLSNMFYEKYRNKVVISTSMEHHSNDLPWRKYIVDYVNVDKDGKISIQDLKTKLERYRSNAWLCSITGASNVTGYKNDINEIAKLCHSYNVKVLIDGAQLIPHSEVNINNEKIEFIAFSGHKMYAPYGSGVLVGLKKELQELKPDYLGGGTVELVTHKNITWLDTPEKDEAGSPNVAGAIAIDTAIDILNKVGMKNIEEYEHKLLIYAENEIRNIPGAVIYGDDTNNKISIISFNIDGINHDTLAKILANEFGIGVRSGCFCAHSYVRKLLNIDEDLMLNKNYADKSNAGMVRMSMGLYNTKREINYLLYALDKISKKKDEYNNLYLE